MSLEIVGLTDWRWKGRRFLGMAANKGGSHAGHSYSGKGSRPRLDRSNANKGIDYDSTGSLRRRRRHTADVEEDDSDVSGHSREDWTVDEFSVHGKQDVAEMNMMFRYLGLPGPANLGIDNEAYEQIKRTSSMGSPVDGFQYTPRFENRAIEFSFRQDSDRSPPSLAPLPGIHPRPPVSSPVVVGQFARTYLEAPPVIPQREQTPTGGAQARAVENRTSTTSEAARPNPPSGETDGAAKRERPSFAGFADVVKKAVAQHHTKIEEDAAGVSNFINSHGGGDLQRMGSLPSSLELGTDRSRSATAAMPAALLGRARSDPLSGSSSRSSESSLVDDKDDVGGGGGGLKGQNAAKAENRVRDSSGSAASTTARVADSRKPQERREGVKAAEPVVLKPLKPPPPGSRMLKIQPDQFSSRDFVNSLGPDSEDLIASVFSGSDDDDDDDKRKSESEDGQESDAGETGASPAQANHLPNGGDVPASDGKPQGSRSDLTVEVPDKTLEQIAEVKIHEHPEPAVALAPIVPVGPKHPWSKGDMLGQGSFGTVYDAVDSDGMWFAVKEVSMVEQDKQAQQAIAQLMQEIELLSQFKHDNVVQYLGTEKAHGKLYIFLELVSKGSLATICKRIKLTHSQISAYTRQILKGLKYLHDRNIVHRDIKCANILVDTMGVCKLADFGMAKQMNSLDQMKSCKGSAYWMAPEVIDPKKFSGLPADIWSLGCSILEMATGSPPFGDMEWYRVLWTVGHGNAPPIPETLSDTAKDFVKHCLDINPSKRPTATELLQHPFVRQDGPGTPSCNSGIPFTAVSINTLQTITEDFSGEFDKGRSSQDSKSLANGHAETASS